MYDDKEIWLHAINTGLLKKKDGSPFSISWVDILLRDLKEGKKSVQNDVYPHWKKAYDQAAQAMGRTAQPQQPPTQPQQYQSQPPPQPVEALEPIQSQPPPQQRSAQPQSNGSLLTGIKHDLSAFDSQVISTTIYIDKFNVFTSLYEFDENESVEDIMKQSVENAILKAGGLIGKSFRACYDQAKKNIANKALSKGKKTHVSITLEKRFGNPIIAQNWRRENFAKQFGKDFNSIESLLEGHYDTVIKLIENISNNDVELWKKAFKVDQDLLKNQQPVTRSTVEPTKEKSISDGISDDEIPF